MTENPTPMNPAYLPPRPDPDSGQPRPPTAPTNYFTQEPTPTGRTPRKHPPIPDGQGPTLEWIQDSTTSAIVSGLIAFAIGISVYVVNGYTKGYGFDWVKIWWLWLLPIIFGLLMYKAMSLQWVAAGATWLQNRNAWVNVYELTSIDVKASGAKFWLRLTDSEGRSISSLSLADAQRNRALWNLVYNGILHSVVTGKADPPANVRTILKLPGGRGGRHRG
jgi:hypothetical protein